VTGDGRVTCTGSVITIHEIRIIPCPVSWSR